MSRKANIVTVHDSADRSTPLVTDGGEEAEAPEDAEQAESEEEPEEQEGGEGTEEQEETEGEEAGAEEEGESAKVLHLDIEGLFLNLLGLQVDLDEVVLDIDAVQGPNNLLGNLLSAVAGLLSKPGSLLSGGLSNFFDGIGSKISDGAKGLVKDVSDELDLSLQKILTRFIKELVSQLTDGSESTEGSES